MKKRFKKNDGKKQKRPVKIDRSTGLQRTATLLLLTLLVTLVVEAFNQETPARMISYLTHRPLFFLLNYLVILTTMSITTLFKRRRAITLTMAALWMVLGFANFMVSTNRTQPLVSGDLIITPEIFGMITLYFTLPQIIAMYDEACDVRRIDMCIGEKEFWGKGIGTILVRMLVKFAFEKEGVDVLHCFCEDYNVRSRRVWEKNGFSLIMEEKIPQPSKGKLQYHWRLTREEYIRFTK